MGRAVRCEISHPSIVGEINGIVGGGMERSDRGFSREKTDKPTGLLECFAGTPPSHEVKNTVGWEAS